MKKQEVVNKNNQTGKRRSNKNYIICSEKKDFMKNNYGIAVGKKLGNAVIRNKLKRQIRQIIDNNGFLFPNFHNYIIILKRDILLLNYKQKENELKKLLNNKGE